MDLERTLVLLSSPLLRIIRRTKAETALERILKPVRMTFPGSESIHFDMEKMRLLSVSKGNLVLKQKKQHTKQ